MNNAWNIYIFQILRGICDGNFLFRGNFLSRPPKLFELTHNNINTNLKCQDPEFYSRLFDESENGPFEFPPGHIKTYV